MTKYLWEEICEETIAIREPYSTRYVQCVRVAMFGSYPPRCVHHGGRMTDEPRLVAFFTKIYEVPVNEKLMWEMWAVFELMRRIGFTPEQIFGYQGVMGSPNSPRFGKTCGFVELRVGALKFAVDCGESTMSEAEFDRSWKAHHHAIQVASEAALQIMWDDSMARAESVVLLSAIIDKGFKIPVAGR